jgi:hypothetical protein
MTALLLAIAVLAQSPDSARQARYEGVLNQATDSLDRVRGASAAFRTDLGSASRSLVLERASKVQASCRAAGSALRTVAALLDEGVYAPRAARQQADLRRGTTELRRTLERCQRDWAATERASPAQADSLRAWGPHRTAQLDLVLRRYLGLVREFMKHAELKKPAVS